MQSTSTIIEFPTAQKGRLLKILGVGFGLAVAVGGAIGGGIIRNPGTVAANLGSEWLVIGAWTLGGIFALIGANSYAELSTSLPEDGGPFVFIRRAYGNFWGFAGGVVDFSQNCLAQAYLSIAFGEYFVTLFPALAGGHNAVAAAILLVLAFLNWLGVRAGELTQKLTSLAKVAGFLGLAVAAFIFGSKESFEAQPIISVLTLSSPLLIFGAVALAMNSVIGTYAGWNCPSYFSEENTNSTRNLPRALFGGVLLVMTVYLFVNAALLYAMPIGNIAASKLPAAELATSIAGGVGGTLITILALGSILGILNGSLMYVPRILFAVGRAGYLPSSVTNVNTGGTPSTALFINVALAALLAMSGTFETLLGVSVFLFMVAEIGVYLSLFVLRRTEPSLARPFRAFGYPFIPAIALLGALGIVVLFIVGNTTTSLYAIGILLLLHPAFLIVKWLLKN